MKNRLDSWLAAPVLFFAAIAALALAWCVAPPENLIRFFDQDGRSTFELATLPVFAAVVPAVWLLHPFGGSRRRRIVLCAMASIVAIMAIVKETDLHNMALHCLFPDYVGEDGALLPGLAKPDGSPLSGTPFKMRVLTNGGVPAGMKALIVFYFVSFFGVFAAGLAYFAIPWIKGVFALQPAAWSFGCLGASGVTVQIFDRLPAWWRGAQGLAKDDLDLSFRAFCTCFEEGMEMAIALFALLAIWQASREGRDLSRPPACPRINP